MTARSIAGFIIAIALTLAAAAAARAEAPGQVETKSLAALTGAAGEARLDAERRRFIADFTIADGAEASAIALSLAAAPDAEGARGDIVVTVNGSRPVVLSPRPEAFEARFALYADSLREGANRLMITLEGGPSDAWAIDAEASALAIQLSAPQSPPGTLAALERRLGADFAGPEHVFIDAGAAGAEAVSVAALAAQGAALRLGRAPVLVGTAETADLRISARLGEGPLVRLEDGAVILSGPDEAALLGAARLFAARSLSGAGATFDVADAISADALVASARASGRAGEGLDGLASSGAPFARSKGSGAGVVFAAADGADRRAAISVAARAALASGGAWTYAWYGDSVEAAPPGLDLMVIGGLDEVGAEVLRTAPAPVRDAAEAARRRLPTAPRPVGSVAFASQIRPAHADPYATGFAALFEDRGGRTLALISAPEEASFAKAAGRLARTGLWANLHGEAAVWDETGVTGFAPSGFTAPDLGAAARFVRAHDRMLALSAFTLSMALLLLGAGVNRASSPRR